MKDRQFGKLARNKSFVDRRKKHRTVRTLCKHLKRKNFRPITGGVQCECTGCRMVIQELSRDIRSTYIADVVEKRKNAIGGKNGTIKTSQFTP